MGKLTKLLNGGEDKEKSTLWTTPWAWRDEDGLYVGWNGQVWLYRSMPLAPIAGEWEDAPTQIAVGRQLAQALTELGETSREGLPGLSSTADHREVHIVTVQWEAEPKPPEDVAGPLREYLEETLDFLIPSKMLLIGVRLRPEGQIKGTSVIEGLKRTLTSTLGESVPDIDAFTKDRDTVDAVLRRSGGRRPRREELRQLEGWYNLGRGPDATIVEYRDHIEVAERTRLEMAAVLSFEQSVHFAPAYQWAYSAETHPDGIRMMSVRAELEPANSARRRARQSQRRIKAQIDEELATGDIERPEYSDTYQLASAVEEHFIGSSEPLLSRCSVVMARRAEDVLETYIDYLRNQLDIECRPLDNRQLPALDETLPCSSKRVNPFLQELSIGMIAYAGLGGFSNLGDRKGVYVGVAHPNYTPTYLDILGAPARNKPPSMAIFGDPGSGKALPLDAPILTPTGWTTMGELSVGDPVIGRDGKAHRVTGVYPQGTLPMYRITFSDGSSTECCAEHLWAVRRSVDCARGKGWRTMSTAELLTVGLHDKTGRNLWSIPMVEPVAFEAADDLPLDPYLVGALLGDGGLTAHVGFSSADAPILDQIRAALPARCELVHRKGCDYAIVSRNRARHDLTGLLAELGWVGSRRNSRVLPEWVLQPQHLPRLIAGIQAASESRPSPCPPAAAAQIVLASAAGTVRTVWQRRSHTNRHAWGAGTRVCALDAPESDATHTEPDLDVPVDPWVLGVLLVRASTTHDTVYCSGSAELLGQLTDRLPGSEAIRDRDRWRLRSDGPVNEVRDALAELELMGCGSLDKFIPERYRFASTAARVAVLQGLMDTDGESGPRGITFNSSSPRLVADVTELVQLLGGTVRVTSRIPSGHDGRAHARAYRLAIRLPEHIVPFRLPRKLQTWQSRTRRAAPARTITSIEPIGEAAAQCIAVDAPDRLYVTGHGVVTHNTYLSQMLAYQATLSGVPTIFINPKGFDTLAPLVSLCGGRLVSMSRLENEGGAFDPFRYAPTGEMAAEILTNHILSVLTGFTEQEELNLAYGLRQAAERGARCAADALRGVADRSIVERVVQQVKTSPTFALGFGLTPQEPFDVDKRLTLIEFDRKLDLPDPGKDASTHTRSERVALSAIRLVTRASIEILARARGGMMVVDEAWTFLSHPAGLAALQQLGREGRSLNILPVFCTQRVADLLGSDMEGYLSRVFVMALREEREAKAALRLCGVEPTEGRLQWLADAGPQSGEGGEARWAAALHRDLDNRHAAVLVGPVPQRVHQAITTNPVERERIRRTLAAQQDPNQHAPNPSPNPPAS